MPGMLLLSNWEFNATLEDLASAFRQEIKAIVEEVNLHLFAKDLVSPSKNLTKP